MNPITTSYIFTVSDVECLSLFSDWPVGVNVAIVAEAGLSPSPIFRVEMFHGDRRTEALLHLCGSLRMQPSDMNLYPQTEGFGYFDIGFKQEMSLLSMLEETYGIVETAKDFLINYNFEVAEGLSVAPINTLPQVAEVTRERKRESDIPRLEEEIDEIRRVVVPSIRLSDLNGDMEIVTGWVMRQSEDYFFFQRAGSTDTTEDISYTSVDPNRILVFIDGTGFTILGADISDAAIIAIPMIKHLVGDHSVTLIDSPAGLTIKLYPHEIVEQRLMVAERREVQAPVSTVRHMEVMGRKVDRRYLIGAAAVLAFLAMAFILNVPNDTKMASVEATEDQAVTADVIATDEYLDDLRVAIDLLEAKDNPTK